MREMLKYSASLSRIKPVPAQKKEWDDIESLLLGGEDTPRVTTTTKPIAAISVVPRSSIRVEGISSTYSNKNGEKAVSPSAKNEAEWRSVNIQRSSVAWNRGSSPKLNIGLK